MKKVLTTLALIALLSTPAFADNHEAKKDAHPHKDHAVHWGYTGEGAAENWGSLKQEYEACASGQFQSPVDLNATITADLPTLEVDYKPVPLTIVNNGHTIQVNYPEGSSMMVDGVQYDLLQFHFHTPSEHTINGQSFPMELHLVHKTKEGALGVLGVMIEQGEHNDSIQSIWNHVLSSGKEPTTHEDTVINGAALLPATMNYFRLSGSLTTPPCSEGVNWHVLAEPIQASTRQITAFRTLYPVNARPVQPSNSRLIVIDK